MAADAPHLIDQAPLVLRWAVLSALAPIAVIALLHVRRVRFTIVHVPLALLIGWAAFSLVWSPDRAVAIDAIWKMVLGAFVFLVGHETENLRPVYIGAALGLLPSSIVAIIQVLGYALIDPAGNVPTGLFGSPNMMGEAAALAFVGLVASQTHALIPAVLPALALPQSRGALLAAIVGVATVSRRWLVVLCLCAGALAVVSLHRELIDLAPIGERVQIWHDAIIGLSVQGHGIGSFALVFPQFSQRPYALALHAHNDALELVFELGLIGGLLALIIVTLLMVQACDADRLVLLALGVEALFGFSCHMPATAFLGAVVAGHAARGWPLLRQRQRVSGVALPARA
jgi:hypothetical protein